MALTRQDVLLGEDLPSRLGRRVSRAESLAEIIEAEIAKQNLEEGDPLGTREALRSRFGVAPATVSEAVRLLEIRGIATARGGAGGGLFVAGVAERARRTRLILGLDWEQATLMDCVTVRDALEPAVVRAAAENATASDFRDLADMVTAMAATSGSHEYLAANWAFHRRIGRISANPPLRSMYLTVVDFLEAGMDDFDVEFPTSDAIAVHRELLSAMADPGSAAIDRALKRHAKQSPLATASRRRQKASSDR